MSVSLAPSFFGAVPEGPREDLLEEYLQLLEVRNGTTDLQGAYPQREAWLAAMNASAVRYNGHIDASQFERSLARFEPGPDTSPAMVTLLAMLKLTAGKSYGVEAVTEVRSRRPLSSGIYGLFERIERLVGKEEAYHSRILMGATRQFDLPEPKAASRPPLPVRGVIRALLHLPRPLFHPLLLGSEIGGVFTFNWMLGRVHEHFGDQPAIRDLLEERLMEILVDEVGHVAFNRLAVGPRGLGAARRIAAQVAHGGGKSTPELRALGWSEATLAEFERFDLSSLPAHVRKRAFFA